MRTWLLLLLGLGVVPAGHVLAQGGNNEHKITLRIVMQELQAEFLRLANAMSMEDFDTLAKSAEAIRNHQMSDELVAGIKNKLGRSFHEFERLDELSHKAAGDLAERAAAKDIIGSVKAFGRMSEACASCHKQYRSTLRPLSD